MKNGMKLALFGAAAAVAAAGVLLYKRYQDSYEEIPAEESDFKDVPEAEDDIPCYVTEEEEVTEE